MANIKLNEGLWVRQILKGKRKVRITYIPNDASQPLQHEKLSVDDDNKSTWKALLGVADAFDIDTGVIHVRFNADNSSGTMTFLPDKSTQEIIVHSFQQGNPSGEIPVAGPPEFTNCIQGKSAALGVAFNYPRAFAECLPQLLV